ncbi:MAG TPA: MFS transporter [Anaerovoracaceae bacterium]|nr:MFS transporter [Anaerovoracaceae bacterium]
MKLSLKTKLAYGLAGVGDAALYTLIGTFLLFFLNTVAGISPAIAGTIAAVGAIWETLCGGIVGYISDRTNTRYGRRKPFLLSAAFPLAIFTSLLFKTIDVGDGFKIFYYGLMLILFWTAFAFFFVPYHAWGAELALDYDERTTLRGYTYVLNTIGMAFGMVLPTVIVDYLMDLGTTKSFGWQCVGILCGSLGFVTIFIAAIIIKDKDEIAWKQNKDNQVKKPQQRLSVIKENEFRVGKMLREYAQVLSLKSTRYVIGASIAYLIGYSIFCADRIYFLTFNLGLTAGQITAVMAFLTFASVIFVPFVFVANKHYDKRTIYITGMTLCGVTMFAFRFIGFDSLALFIVFGFAYSVGGICYWQLIPSMIYDVCEVDELAHNKKRAGVVISLQSLSESASNALGLQIMGLLLQFSGFDAEASVQTSVALNWTAHTFSMIPACFMLISVIMIALYPIKKKNFRQVVKAIEMRKAGEEIHLENFKDLI